MFGTLRSKVGLARFRPSCTILLRTTALCSAMLVLWVVAGVFLVVAGVFLFVTPDTDVPQRTDVLFVLAPQGARTAYAEQLMDQGLADTLALSTPRIADASAALCTQKRAYRIICFDPDPVTTQGEARGLQILSEKYGWKSATVLTAQFHVSRARVLLQRCYRGDLTMVAFRQDMRVTEFPTAGRSSWAYHFAYESAAFIKVALNKDC